MRDAAKAAEEARKEAEEYQRKLIDLDEAAAGYCAKECDRLDSLYKAATDQSKSTDERRKAAERLQKLYPDYFKNLTAEQIMVGQAKQAYDQLRDSIIEVARARVRAAAAKIEENEKELLTLEQQAPGLKAKRDKDKAAYDAAVAQWEEARRQESYRSASYTNSTDAAASGLVNVTPYANAAASAGNTYNASEAAYQSNVRKQKQLNEANEFLRENRTVMITYRSFIKADAHTFPIEPYCVKLFEGRWYVLAHNIRYDDIRIYGLDRIKKAELTNDTFKLPKNFSAAEYFSNYYGIYTGEHNEKPERVIIRANRNHKY